MKARLMFDDHDFDPDHTEAPGDADLIQDLDLDTLWAAAAGDDKIVHAAVRTAMLEPLTDPAAIDYRADVLADCLAQPAIIHRLYELACQAIDQERQIYRASFYSHSSEALLNRSVTALRMFVVILKKLRDIADQCATGFSSTGLRRFLATLETELTDSYFAEIDDHLRFLRFHDGLVATAQLGRHSQGTDYVLRTPPTEQPETPPTATPPSQGPVLQPHDPALRREWTARPGQVARPDCRSRRRFTGTSSRAHPQLLHRVTCRTRLLHRLSQPPPPPHSQRVAPLPATTARSGHSSLEGAPSLRPVPRATARSSHPWQRPRRRQQATGDDHRREPRG